MIRSLTICHTGRQVHERVQLLLKLYTVRMSPIVLLLICYLTKLTSWAALLVA